MSGLILTELMSLISFIFSVLIFIIPYTSINNFVIIFLWMILVSYLGADLKRKNKRYLYTCILMFLPLIKYNTISDVIFLFVATFFIYYYIFNYFGDMNFGYIKEDFVKKLIFYVIIIFVNLIYKIYNLSKTDNILFMILYFISTIMLLRSLRHLEYNQDIKRINKANLNYTVIMSIVSLMFSIDKFRDGFLNGLKNSWKFMTNSVYKLLYFPMVLLTYFWDWLLKIIWSSYEVIEDEQPKVSAADEEMADAWKKMYQESAGLPTWVKTIISIVSKLIIILVIIYIIKRILKVKLLYKRKEEKAYIEEREFIDINERGKDKKPLFLFKPRDIGEQIRYYYKKYLIKAQKKGITIKNSDTSLDVNRKAKWDFDKEDIEELRDIYIETRYGEKEASKDKADEMKRLYKEV